MSLVIGTLVNTGLIVLDLSVYLIYIVPSLICMDSEDVTGVDGVHIVLVVGIDLRVVDKTGGLINSVVGILNTVLKIVVKDIISIDSVDDLH